MGHEELGRTGTAVTCKKEVAFLNVQISFIFCGLFNTFKYPEFITILTIYLHDYTSTEIIFFSVMCMCKNVTRAIQWKC